MLYDHQADPAEDRNIAGEADQAELVNQLGEQLREVQSRGRTARPKS